MSAYGVVVVYTISSAIRSEKVLAKAGVASKLIPVPCQFSSDCVLAVRFLWERVERVRTLLADAHVEIARIQPLV